MKGLTKEQEKELKMIASEIEAEAIQLRLDYEENPSAESGSIIVVHEDAEVLKDDEKE